MTENELEGLARQALNMAKTELEQKDRLGMLLASYRKGERLYRMSKIEANLVEKLGQGWLDDWRRKEAGYGWLRIALQIVPPDAIVIVTATDMFRSTEKMAALPDEERKKAIERSNDPKERRKMAAEGLFTITDGLTAVAQAAERVCISTQAIEHGAFAGQPITHHCLQANFHGRQKMYGGLSKEEEAEIARTRAELLEKRCPGF